MAEYLDLGRCPWCNTATPTLEKVVFFKEKTPNIHTCIFECSRCSQYIMGRFYMGRSDKHRTQNLIKFFPNDGFTLHDNIPERARDYLEQAQDTIHSPDASIMVSASALDIMLQTIGRPKSEGSLSARIKKAAVEHQITQGMADWAHQVRILANESRHPGKDEESPTLEDAKQSLEFLMALADLLFVLPARVTKGIEQTKPKVEQKTE